jgi:fermentation-respiration switch protein FrsA (DUF1100 family)
MPASTPTASAPHVPLRSPFLTAALAWLIPGAGHFLLGRRARAIIIFLTVLAAFAVGLLLHGPIFQPGGADVLTRVINTGGFIGDIASGAFYFIAVSCGYFPPDTGGHASDYGSKFLVVAGLLNILSIVDAYEIATRQKD